MKVLGVVLGPHREGNTAFLVKKVLESAEISGAEIELAHISGKRIEPCDGCLSCEERGECKIEDDMRQIYPKLLEADGIVFGSPVYFWNVSGQAKVFIDRTYCFLRKRKMRNKVGGIVVTARRAGGTNAFQVFLNFFNAQRMRSAGGVIGLGEKIGSAKDDGESLGEAMAVGKIIVRLIKQDDK